MTWSDDDKAVMRLALPAYMDALSRSMEQLELLAAVTIREWAIEKARIDYEKARELYGRLCPRGVEVSAIELACHSLLEQCGLLHVPPRPKRIVDTFGGVRQ